MEESEGASGRGPTNPQSAASFQQVSGIEYLIPTSGLIIQQQIEWGEIMIGIEFNNRYHVVDDLGRRLFFAAENSDAMSLICLGNCRSWNIILFDTQGNPVINGSRQSSCCCNGLCGNEITVTSAAGDLVLGRLSQNNTCCTGSWNILDAEGNIILLMEGPGCSIFCPSAATCFEAEFPIKTVHGDKKIGKVTKQFSGMLQEMYTKADTFCVEYPPDLHVNIKAVLIYAAFMIDFIYYENKQNQHRHHHHHGYY